MRAIVTGAARGIGRAIALRLARDAQARGGGGASLAIVDRHVDELAALEVELRALGARPLALAGDLGDADFPARACAAAVAEFGGLDAVVANAAVAIPAPLSTCPVAAWDQVFAVNVRAPFLLAQAAHVALRASRGSVLVVTSISATCATPPLGAYSPSKAASLMLVRQLAAEWGADGIRVNALSPGLTLTPGTAQAYVDESVRAQREARVPLGRLAQPGDMAAAAAFLVGSDAAYVTGAELVVDGGLAQTLMGSLPMGGWQRPLSASASS